MRMGRPVTSLVEPRQDSALCSGADTGCDPFQDPPQQLPWESSMARRGLLDAPLGWAAFPCAGTFRDLAKCQHRSQCRGTT